VPGFDGTGPRGMGPMTGGGRGFCVLPLGRIGPPTPATMSPMARTPWPRWNAWSYLGSFMRFPYFGMGSFRGRGGFGRGRAGGGRRGRW